MITIILIASAAVRGDDAASTSALKVMDAFIAANHIDKLIAGEGWDHSKWDSLSIVQRSPKKVHIAVSFRRGRSTSATTAGAPSSI